MNIRGLRALIAVAECESVTEAASRLDLSQSGVSRQLAALEREVGFQVFERAQGRLALNRRGVAFLRHARRTVEALDELPRAARSIASGAADRLEIAATSAIVHGLLPPVIARYVQARPGLPPSIVMRSLRQIVELSQSDRFDLVLVPHPLRPPGLVARGFISFDLQVAVPAGRLILADGELTLAALEGLPFISLDPFATYQESVEKALTAVGVGVDYVCETTSVLAAARLVGLGVGCALLDPFVAKAMPLHGGEVRTVTPAITHRYGLYVPPGNATSAELDRLLDLLEAATAELRCEFRPVAD